MSRLTTFDMAEYPVAEQASVNERADFIRKTYLHLLGVVMAFAVIEFVIFSAVDVEGLTATMVGGFNWLIVFGLFLVVNWMAGIWARSATSLLTQYAGLTLYLAAEAVIFVLLPYIASVAGGKDVILTAAIISLLMFGGLPAVVLTTAKDFSFLGSILWLGGLAAMGLIVCAILFGFSLGLIFTVAMITLACGFIL